METCKDCNKSIDHGRVRCFECFHANARKLAVGKYANHSVESLYMPELFEMADEISNT